MRVSSFQVSLENNPWKAEVMPDSSKFWGMASSNYLPTQCPEGHPSDAWLCTVQQLMNPNAAVAVLQASEGGFTELYPIPSQ